MVIGCVSGGSNFSDFAFPFVRDKINCEDMDFVVADPAACPTLTKGEWHYDFGDTMGMTPLVVMYTLGHTFTPAPIHAGKLRYHCDAPLLCQVVKDGLIRAEAHEQNDVFASAVQFARAEGIIPAPESSHAVKSAIDAAVQAKEAGKEKTILFGLSGHGHFDMLAYENYFAGSLEDMPFSDEDLKERLAALEGLPV